MMDRNWTPERRECAPGRHRSRRRFPSSGCIRLNRQRRVNPAHVSRLASPEISSAEQIESTRTGQAEQGHAHVVGDRMPRAKADFISDRVDREQAIARSARQEGTRPHMTADQARRDAQHGPKPRIPHVDLRRSRARKIFAPMPGTGDPHVLSARTRARRRCAARRCDREMPWARISSGCGSISRDDRPWRRVARQACWIRPEGVAARSDARRRAHQRGLASSHPLEARRLRRCTCRDRSGQPTAASLRKMTRR